MALHSIIRSFRLPALAGLSTLLLLSGCEYKEIAETPTKESIAKVWRADIPTANALKSTLQEVEHYSFALILNENNSAEYAFPREPLNTASQEKAIQLRRGMGIWELKQDSTGWLIVITEGDWSQELRLRLHGKVPVLEAVLSTPVKKFLSKKTKTQQLVFRADHPKLIEALERSFAPEIKETDRPIESIEGRFSLHTESINVLEGIYGKNEGTPYYIDFSHNGTATFKLPDCFIESDNQTWEGLIQSEATWELSESSEKTSPHILLLKTAEGSHFSLKLGEQMGVDFLGKEISLKEGLVFKREKKTIIWMRRDDQASPFTIALRHIAQPINKTSKIE